MILKFYAIKCLSYLNTRIFIGEVYESHERDAYMMCMHEHVIQWLDHVSVAM